MLLGKQSERFKLAVTNGETLRIGCAKNRSKYTHDGVMIDEATLWRRPLSLDEIKMAMTGDIMVVVFPKDMLAVAWGAIKTSLRQLASIDVRGWLLPLPALVCASRGIT